LMLGRHILGIARWQIIPFNRATIEIFWLIDVTRFGSFNRCQTGILRSTKQSYHGSRNIYQLRLDFKAIPIGQDISATSKWFGAGVASGSACNLVRTVKVLDIIFYC
jgi:hypothetical protein